MGKETYESVKERRDDYRQQFRDHKWRLTYYMLSLPFALAGVAIASYPYPEDVHIVIVLIEVAAWLALLAAGGAGLFSKYGEMSQAGEASARDSGRMDIYEHPPINSDETREVKNAEYELSKASAIKLNFAKNIENYGFMALCWFLGLGIMLWVMSRLVLSIGAV